MPTRFFDIGNFLIKVSLLKLPFVWVSPLHGRRVGYLLFLGFRGYAVLVLVAQSEGLEGSACCVVALVVSIPIPDASDVRSKSSRLFYQLASTSWASVMSNESNLISFIHFVLVVETNLSIPIFFV